MAAPTARQILAGPSDSGAEKVAVPSLIVRRRVRDIIRGEKGTAWPKGRDWEGKQGLDISAIPGPLTTVFSRSLGRL